MFGIVLGAAYMLWLYQRTMFGKLENPENARLKDLNLREIMTLAPIVACCFWIGLYPMPFLDVLKQPVSEIVQRLDATGGPAIASAPATGTPSAATSSAAAQTAGTQTAAAGR